MTLHALSSAVQYVAYRRGHDDPPRPRHGVLRLGRRRGYLVGSGARRRLRRFWIAAVTVAVAGVMVIIMPLGSHVDGSLDQRQEGRSTDVLAGKKISEQEFRRPQHNHLTSINAEIDRRDNGSVLIAQRISNI